MSNDTKKKSTHWADITADKIIRERGKKEHYTCASGITPSGTVHIGNFREIISVELVVRALRDKGEKVRFIYSWDDYDVFRKVPKNMPEQELLTSYLRKPITLVPDVLGNEESYAAANEKNLEALLPTVGVFPEYIYQAKRYRNSEYAEGIRKALVHQDDIRRQLNESRTSDLPADWMPVSVFCTACDRDTTKVTGWDGDYGVSFECECGHKETVDLRTTAAVKLPWRIDWPMRWKQEDVDFEPAGKDHHSEGGSFDTAKKTGKEVYDHEPPVTFQYDFIRIKGRGGKISSSTGEVISLSDVLEVYQPEIIRYLFAGTRPNTEFAISFDLDVLKIYEDYDKCERTYFSKPETPKALKNWEKQARIYELSQVGEVPAAMPYQMQIRHLCNLLQVHSGDIDAVVSSLKDLDSSQEARFRQRCACAWVWVKEFAPEDFRYSLRTPEEGPIELDEKNLTAVRRLAVLVEENLESMEEKEFGTKVYDMMKELELESADFFTAVYQTLISKEKGPRLISFLYTLGKEKVLSLLKLY
jgi:lysyl-tRNA synthetase class 1